MFLRKILADGSDSCEYTAFVDKDGITQIKIQSLKKHKPMPGIRQLANGVRS